MEKEEFLAALKSAGSFIVTKVVAVFATALIINGGLLYIAWSSIESRIDQIFQTQNSMLTQLGDIRQDIGYVRAKIEPADFRKLSSLDVEDLIKDESIIFDNKSVKSEDVESPGVTTTASFKKFDSGVYTRLMKDFRDIVARNVPSNSKIPASSDIEQNSENIDLISLFEDTVYNNYGFHLSDIIYEPFIFDLQKISYYELIIKEGVIASMHKSSRAPNDVYFVGRYKYNGQIICIFFDPIIRYIGASLYVGEFCPRQNLDESALNVINEIYSQK